MNVKLVRALPNEKVVKIAEPTSLTEEVAILRSQVRALQQAFLITKKAYIASKNNSQNAYDINELNEKCKIDIPIGTTMIGITKGMPFLLTVKKDGKYLVGESTFKSLSAAAQAVSGNQRSGWIFWKTLDGLTAKEAFRTRNGKAQQEEKKQSNNAV
jgi:hypothetical protein